MKKMIRSLYFSVLRKWNKSKTSSELVVDGMSSGERMIAVLNDTVKYYSEDVNRRAAGKGNYADTCVYTTIEGNHCGVGRFLKEKYQTYEFSYNNGMGAKGLFEIYDRDVILKNNVSDLPVIFWASIQRLHDAGINWDKNGITKNGEDYADNIMDRIITNSF